MSRFAKFYLTIYLSLLKGWEIAKDYSCKNSRLLLQKSMILFSILVWYAIILVDCSPERGQTSWVLVSDFSCIYWGIVFSIHLNVTLYHISLKLTYHSLYWYYWHNDLILWLMASGLKFIVSTSLSISLFNSP